MGLQCQTHLSNAPQAATSMLFLFPTCASGVLALLRSEEHDHSADMQPSPLGWCNPSGDAHVLLIQAHGSQHKQLACCLKKKLSAAVPYPACPF